MFRLLVVMLLFMVIAQQKGFSQDYLLLTKKNRTYRVVFAAGDELRFKLKGDKQYHKALIKGFKENEIVFHYYSINLSEISVIDVSHKKFTVFSFTSGPGKLLISGAALIMIDQFNQTVIQGEPFGVDGNLALIGGALSASGILLKLIQKKYWKLEKPKHKASILLD